MFTFNSLSKLRKAELVALVVKLEASLLLVDMGSAELAVIRLAAELGELDPSQGVDVATALSLARALDAGPELARAGIAKQLLAVTDRLEVEEAEADFVDQLASRRSVLRGSDSSQAAG